MKTKIRKNRTGIIGIATVIACAIVLISTSAFAEIVLEIHSNTANNSVEFTDSSNPARTITANGGAKHSTLEKKFGISSMFFDGDGDYLSMDSSSEWAFETGDFTIDFWYYASSGAVDKIRFFSNCSNDFLPGGINLRFNDDLNRFYMQSRNNSGEWTENPFDGIGGALPAEIWTHLAIVKDGADLKLFLDGVQSGATKTAPTEIGTSSTPLRIASANWASRYFTGYLDDFYIRKGEALTANEIEYISDLGGQSLEALDQYVRASVISIGNDKRLALTSGVNDGGVDQFSFGYTDQEISQLAEMYAEGTGTVTIGDLTWSYLNGELPGDLGGTKSIGEAYMHDGKWYIKLGSGLEGVPEVPAGVLPFTIMALLGAAPKVRRKLFRR